MALVPTWPIAAICLAVGVAGGAVPTRLVYVAKIDRINAQHTEELRQREVKRGDDERAARARESTLALRAGQIEQEKINEVDRIRALLAAADVRLQNRPDRKPAGAGGMPAPTPACQGSTGAELSKQDGQFLTGEAARGDELRAALSACYGAYDSVGR